MKGDSAFYPDSAFIYFMKYVSWKNILDLLFGTKATTSDILKSIANPRKVNMITESMKKKLVLFFWAF